MRPIETLRSRVCVFITGTKPITARFPNLESRFMQTRRFALMRRLPLARGHRFVGFAAALAAVLAAFGLRLAIDDWLPPGFPFVTFLPVVVLAAFLFGTRSGIVAALAAALLCWFFLLPQSDGLLHGDAVFALLFFAFICGVNIFLIDMLQRYNGALDKQSEQLRLHAENRDLLFRELQHRISNNLQVIASLLSFRRRHITDAEARDALDEAANRLTLIGKISRQLYDVDEMRAGMQPFLEKLAGEILAASGREDIACRFAVDNAIRLVPESAIPLALIFTEIVSNALEHGFADGLDGQLEVTMTRRDGQIEMLVEDNGRGLPQDFDITQTTSLGLKIAQLLAKQLKGDLQMESAEGTRARLVIAAN